MATCLLRFDNSTEKSAIAQCYDLRHCRIYRPYVDMYECGMCRLTGQRNQFPYALLTHIFRFIEKSIHQMYCHHGHHQFQMR